MERKVTMKIWGYESNGEQLLELSEVTFECKPEEIKKMINFFKTYEERIQKLEEERENNQDNSPCIVHMHYRDFYKNEANHGADFILATRIN